MKILLVHASAGAGHTKAAEALYNRFKKEYPAANCQIIDLLNDTSRLYRWTYKYGYSWLINRAPWLWLCGFWLTSYKPIFALTRPLGSLFNNIYTRRFARRLIKENPDFIVSAHFLSSEIAASLKRRGRIGSKIFTIITDFGVHPLWINPGTDVYITASEYTRQVLISQGIPAGTIKTYGIPVDDKFIVHRDRDSLCREFGIDASQFTILIATGSFGIGPIEEIAAALCTDVQILVVCARNKKLYARLNSLNCPGVKVFGFVNNIEEMMAVSDMIITKPGGLSIVESLIMNLVPVFIAPIPGQETENIKALSTYSIGIEPRSIDEIRDIVLDFKMHPEKLQACRENIGRIRKPSAAKDICNEVCQNSCGTAG